MMGSKAASNGLTSMDVESPLSPSSPNAESAAVIKDARSGVVAFLADHRADEIVPVISRVIVLDVDVSLASALKALYENGVRAAPVADTRTASYVALFSVTDVIAALLRFRYDARGGDISSALSSVSLRAWQGGRPFVAADADGTLLQACRQLRDFRVHRLPVIAKDKTVLCTLEHWRVLRFVHRHLAGIENAQSSALFSMTVQHLGIGTFTGLVSVTEKTALAEVLEVLVNRELSAVPVLSETGKLVNVYSRTDISALARGPITNATLEMSIQQALLSRPNNFRVATCRKEDTLRTVFETFEHTRKHRLYAVNEHGMLAGVLSLSDVLAYFLSAD